MLKGTRTGVLTVGALDLLYQQSQDEGCCPQCCGMCWVLKDQLLSDELDSTVRKAPESMYENSQWWDDHRQMVRRSWLKSAWPTNVTCHSNDDEEEDDDTTADAA